MLEQVLIGLIVWVVGVFFGFILRGAFFSASEVELKLTKKLEKLELEFSDYRQKLGQHLLSSSQVFQKIQEDCVAAQEKISLMTRELDVRKASREDETIEPPKDYSSHS
jgi:uncharacterized membrane-anchored protein YhcB (DUF1043 family)